MRRTPSDTTDIMTTVVTYNIINIIIIAEAPLAEAKPAFGLFKAALGRGFIKTNLRRQLQCCREREEGENLKERDRERERQTETEPKTERGLPCRT